MTPTGLVPGATPVLRTSRADAEIKGLISSSVPKNAVSPQPSTLARNFYSNKLESSWERPIIGAALRGEARIEEKCVFYMQFHYLRGACAKQEFEPDINQNQIFSYCQEPTEYSSITSNRKTSRKFEISVWAWNQFADRIFEFGNQSAHSITRASRKHQTTEFAWWRNFTFWYESRQI